MRGDGQAHGCVHSLGLPSLESTQRKPLGTLPIPSTPYQEGCSVEGLQRQPTALGMEAQLQALGRRMLLAGIQTPVPAGDPLSPTGTFRAQCSFL